MAKGNQASIVKFRKPALTGAERTRRWRERKANSEGVGTPPLPVTSASPVPSGTVTDVTPSPVTMPRRHISSRALIGVAFVLAAVGVTMNGWFARTLGASDAAGWLFLAVGVAADCAALAVPACATRLWQGGERVTALIGWGVWAVTFVFALTSGVGFASVNIADVTASRAGRVTPAVVTAQAALADAMTARDRECHGGVGKFCRERETVVVDRRAALDAAMRTVAGSADPQTEAAIGVVAWLTAGRLTPNSNDFSMLRLVLLALLPQIGGILLMIGRAR